MKRNKLSAIRGRPQVALVTNNWKIDCTEKAARNST